MEYNHNHIDVNQNTENEVESYLKALHDENLYPLIMLEQNLISREEKRKLLEHLSLFKIDVINELKFKLINFRLFYTDVDTLDTLSSVINTFNSVELYPQIELTIIYNLIELILYHRHSIDGITLKSHLEKLRRNFNKFFYAKFNEGHQLYKILWFYYNLVICFLMESQEKKFTKTFKKQCEFEMLLETVKSNEKKNVAFKVVRLKSILLGLNIHFTSGNIENFAVCKQEYENLLESKSYQILVENTVFQKSSSLGLNQQNSGEFANSFNSKNLNNFNSSVSLFRLYTENFDSFLCYTDILYYLCEYEALLDFLKKARMLILDYNEQVGLNFESIKEKVFLIDLRLAHVEMYLNRKDILDGRNIKNSNNANLANLRNTDYYKIYQREFADLSRYGVIQNPDIFLQTLIFSNRLSPETNECLNTFVLEAEKNFNKPENLSRSKFRLYLTSIYVKIYRLSKEYNLEKRNNIIQNIEQLACIVLNSLGKMPKLTMINSPIVNHYILGIIYSRIFACYMQRQNPERLKVYFIEYDEFKDSIIELDSKLTLQIEKIRADYYFREKNFKSALTCYDKIATGESIFNSIICLAKLGDKKNALKRLEKLDQNTNRDLIHRLSNLLRS